MGWDERAIERSTGVGHNTVINWVKQASAQIPEENYHIPETCQVDGAFSCRGDLVRVHRMNWRRLWEQKKRVCNSEVSSECKTHSRHKIWIGTAVDSHQAGVLKWVVGDREWDDFW